MIQRFSIKKIGKYTVLLFIVFLFYLFPNKVNYDLDKEVSKDISINYHDIFLIDKNNYIAKTNIQVRSLRADSLIDELIEAMTIDGKYQDKIPNGFRGVLPSDAKLLSKKIDNNIVILNFNSNLFDVSNELEEKELEAIIYTITSIEKIDTVKIQIEGKELTKLPKSGKLLPSELKREYGINKIYEIDDIKNTSATTIYYLSEFENTKYYTPVTFINNDSEDKIEVIIEKLKSSPINQTNLMSYLASNAELLDYEINENTVSLTFNNYIFEEFSNKDILEEVKYTIGLSIKDNYAVDEVVFNANNEKITNFTLNSLE